MKFSRLTRLFTAWVACCAILMVALAPSISHALSIADAPVAVWTEVCSAHGLKLVKVEIGRASNSSSSMQQALQFEDCPFCATHADSAVLPFFSAAPSPVAIGSFPFPALFYQSPRPLFVWAVPQPRAPPAYS